MWEIVILTGVLLKNLLAKKCNVNAPLYSLQISENIKNNLNATKRDNINISVINA